MLKFLADYTDFWGPLRVLDSITFRAAMALVASFLATVIFSPHFIRALASLRVTEDVNKPDSKKLSDLHKTKRHTPTMGGIIMVMAMLLANALFADLTNPYVGMAVFSVLSYAGIGMVDDYVKLRGLGRHQGLSARSKLLLQIVVAVFIVMALSSAGDTRYLSKLLVPGTKMAEFFPDLGIMYFPFFVMVLVGCSNAVNLTDGLDGLAAGCTLMVAFTFMAMAYIVGHAEWAGYLRIPHVAYTGELTVFCASLVGATLGFLWYNAHPARIFMGDTGSLALGAGISFVALAVKQELVLLIAGGVFVWEALTVILQVGWFKLTKKRIFRCAPFHHHLEFSGMHENHVVVRLWCMGIILAALALSTLKMH